MQNIIVASRGTDFLFKFKYVHPDGSTFVWDQYTTVCEGRLAYANAEPDFLFEVSELVDDDLFNIKIKFTKEQIANAIREQKIYWRVMITENGLTPGDTTLALDGEIWLK